MVARRLAAAGRRVVAVLVGDARRVGSGGRAAAHNWAVLQAMAARRLARAVRGADARSCSCSCAHASRRPRWWSTPCWARAPRARCASRSRPRSTWSTPSAPTPRAAGRPCAVLAVDTPTRIDLTDGSRSDRRSWPPTSPSPSIAPRRASRSTPSRAAWPAATSWRPSASRSRRRMASCRPTASTRRRASPQITWQEPGRATAHAGWGPQLEPGLTSGSPAAHSGQASGGQERSRSAPARASGSRARPGRSIGPRSPPLPGAAARGPHRRRSSPPARRRWSGCRPPGPRDRRCATGQPRRSARDAALHRLGEDAAHRRGRASAPAGARSRRRAARRRWSGPTTRVGSSGASAAASRRPISTASDGYCSTANFSR